MKAFPEAAELQKWLRSIQVICIHEKDQKDLQKHIDLLEVVKRIDSFTTEPDQQPNHPELPL